MNRKDFIKTCGFACFGATTIGTLLQSCTGSKAIAGQIVGDNIIIHLGEFEIIQNNDKSYRNYVVIQNERLKFPICIYRVSEVDYTALYMQCSHQGAELSAYGDKMVCSAHGSEFDKKGMATNGPADKPLKVFPVKIVDQNLQISLKAS